MGYRFGQLGSLLLFRWVDLITEDDARNSLADAYASLGQGVGPWVGIGIFPIPFTAPTSSVIGVFAQHLDDLCQKITSIHLVLEGDAKDTLPVQAFLSDAYKTVQKGELFIHTSFDEALVLMKSGGLELPGPAPEVYSWAVDRGFLRDEEGKLARSIPNPHRKGFA